MVLEGNFINDACTATVFIDGIQATVDNFSSTAITITTPPKPVVDPGFATQTSSCKQSSSLKINIDCLGDVANMEETIMYASKWSDKETWMYICPPVAGEIVHIPAGLNLLLDVDATPILQSIVVEGGLIIEPDSNPAHVRNLNTDSLIIRGGSVEFGSPSHPYTSKLNLNFHGGKDDAKLPVFGNKVLGVTSGCLDIHGEERDILKTRLKTTASVGDTWIELADVPVGQNFDWKVDEEILIVTTYLEGKQSEVRTITSVTGTTLNPIINFADGLDYEHLAVIEDCDGEAIDMRGEVALLTRNIVFQGV